MSFIFISVSPTNACPLDSEPALGRSWNTPYQTWKVSPLRNQGKVGSQILQLSALQLEKLDKTLASVEVALVDLDSDGRIIDLDSVLPELRGSYDLKATDCCTRANLRVPTRILAQVLTKLMLIPTGVGTIEIDVAALVNAENQVHRFSIAPPQSEVRAQPKKQGRPPKPKPDPLPPVEKKKPGPKPKPKEPKPADWVDVHSGLRGAGGRLESARLYRAVSYNYLKGIYGDAFVASAPEIQDTSVALYNQVLNIPSAVTFVVRVRHAFQESIFRSLAIAFAEVVRLNLDPEYEFEAPFRFYKITEFKLKSISGGGDTRFLKKAIFEILVKGEYEYRGNTYVGAQLITLSAEYAEEQLEAQSYFRALPQVHITAVSTPAP